MEKQMSRGPDLKFLILRQISIKLGLCTTFRLLPSYHGLLDLLR